jgi:hypothetical protein
MPPANLSSGCNCAEFPFFYLPPAGQCADLATETPKSIPRAKEGTPPSSYSRSGESKSPDGGSTTSEGEPDEDYSGLALTQLGSTTTPEQLISRVTKCKEDSHQCEQMDGATR